MAETLNMKIVSLDRVLKQVRLQLMSEDYTPVIIIGKSGIGKTESLTALAKELGIGFKELRLSHYQESDLVGLPYIEDGKTKHAETDLLPDSNDTEQGILLLDEVTSSQKSMRSAVYQLLDSSRKLGQYVLPKRWLVVCCGNGPEDGGDFRGIEAALLSRGRCMRVEEDLDTWKKWAVAREIHPVVIAFLSFMPDNLHVIDLDRPNDMIACPRNWVKLSIQLKNMEKLCGGIITDDDDLEFTASSCVGERCGPNFAAFYRYNKTVINAEDILEGTVDASKMGDLDTEALYIIAQNLVHLIKKELEKSKQGDSFTAEAINKVGNICNWLIDVGNQVKLDFTISVFQDLANNVPDFRDIILDFEFDEVCPKLLEFIQENSVVFSKN